MLTNGSQKTTDLNQFFYKYFINYDRLYQMTYHTFYGKTNADRANVFIDMGSFVRSMFEYWAPFSYKDKDTPIAAAMINLAAHIRSYYLSRHGSYMKIYIVWGNQNQVSARHIIPEYNAHYIQAYNANTILKEIVEKNIAVLKLICPYLPGVYFIDGGDVEPGVVIQALINNPTRSDIFTDVPNIVYTRDLYDFQLVANPKTFAFRVKKSGGADNSYVINKTNIFDGYRIENKLKKFGEDTLDYKWYPILYGFSGDRKRHITGIDQYNRLIKTIENYVLQGMLNPEMPTNIIADMFGNTGYKGFSALNIEENLIITQVQPEWFYGVQDLANTDDVKEINNRYFINYPLDLMGL